MNQSNSNRVKIQKIQFDEIFQKYLYKLICKYASIYKFEKISFDTYKFNYPIIDKFYYDTEVVMGIREKLSSVRKFLDDILEINNFGPDHLNIIFDKLKKQENIAIFGYMLWVDGNFIKLRDFSVT